MVDILLLLLAWAAVLAACNLVLNPPTAGYAGTETLQEVED